MTTTMEMWSEANEWINIMFDFSLADIIEVVDHECALGQWLGDAMDAKLNGYPEELVLCAHFQSHEADHSFADSIGPFGLRDTALPTRSSAYYMETSQSMQLLVSLSQNIHVQFLTSNCTKWSK